MTNYIRGKTPWERLKLRVRISDRGCWEYTGTRNRKGYGRISVNGGPMLAHRFAYAHASGKPLPDGVMVLHRCDNPPCCNPAHLYAGGAAANSRDMVARGRAGIGERGSRAKLTEAAVRAIFREYADGRVQVREIAAKHGVSAMTVITAVAGRSWAHLQHLAPPLRRRGRGLKLTADDVRAIRADTRTQRVVAESYGISQGIVSAVRNRRIWTHVE